LRQPQPTPRASPDPRRAARVKLQRMSDGGFELVDFSPPTSPSRQQPYPIDIGTSTARRGVALRTVDRLETFERGDGARAAGAVDEELLEQGLPLRCATAACHCGGRRGVHASPEPARVRALRRAAAAERGGARAAEGYSETPTSAESAGANLPSSPTSEHGVTPHTGWSDTLPALRWDFDINVFRDAIYRQDIALRRDDALWESQLRGIPATFAERTHRNNGRSVAPPFAEIPRTFTPRFARADVRSAVENRVYGVASLRYWAAGQTLLADGVIYVCPWDTFEQLLPGATLEGCGVSFRRFPDRQTAVTYVVENQCRGSNQYHTTFRPRITHATTRIIEPPGVADLLATWIAQGRRR
jgi:hypothetical protein